MGTKLTIPEAKPDCIWKRDINMFFVCLLVWGLWDFFCCCFGLCCFAFVFSGLSLRKKFLMSSLMKKNHLWKMNIYYQSWLCRCSQDFSPELPSFFPLLLLQLQVKHKFSHFLSWLTKASVIANFFFREVVWMFFLTQLVDKVLSDSTLKVISACTLVLSLFFMVWP